MQLSVNFSILSPFFVNVAPVIYLMWLLSDSLFILLLLHFNVFADMIISSCMVRCLTESWTTTSELVEPGVWWQLSVRLLIPLQRFSSHMVDLKLLCIHTLWFLHCFWDFVCFLHVLRVFFTCYVLLRDVWHISFGCIVPAFSLLLLNVVGDPFNTHQLLKMPILVLFLNLSVAYRNLLCVWISR